MSAATINCNSNINYMPARATSTELNLLRLANSCMAPDEFLGRFMTAWLFVLASAVGACV